LEVYDPESLETNNLPPHHDAPGAQGGAGKTHEGAPEGNGTEHHHQEGERTGREKNGTEPNATEGSDHAFKTDRSSAGSGDDSFLRKVDDDANPGEVYATPEEELKALYFKKTAKSITSEVLEAIRNNLELSQVTMREFVAEVKEHAQNPWRNPAGFLRDLSKRFRAKTRSTSAPVTAAEAEERNYRCKICGSPVRGQGVRLVGGKEVPCSCASPEYIAYLRTRGIHAAEARQ
jgi:hypothetical protein